VGNGMTAFGRGIIWSAMTAVALAVGGCAVTEVPPHLRPLSNDTVMMLGRKGMEPAQPMFVRVFKEESELEVWKQRTDGRYHHFKTYPICNWSGDLGPKVKQGDRQSPEGFYTVNRNQMNPNSSFHLAFNIGYPNAYDRAQGRSGDFLMVHGKCKSAGCYAMTDALIEEIYALARESFIGGQDVIDVHAYPFRMTDENMARYQKHGHSKFWATLKEGYDYFETTRLTPAVAVCEKKYLVNAKWKGNVSRIEPTGACPAFERIKPDPFVSTTQQIAEPRLIAPGPKTRLADSIGVSPAPAETEALTATRMGLGASPR
jgi:murein L,D-transpeptidase YafK